MRAASIKARYWSASARMEIFGEIDLLLPRQRQQNVERTFKASTSTIRAGSSAADRRTRLRTVSAHLAAFRRNPVRARARHELRRIRPGRDKIERRGRSQRQRGLGPPPRFAREFRRCRGDRSISVKVPLQCKAISQPAASAAVALRQAAGQRAHREIVTHQEPRNR